METVWKVVEASGINNISYATLFFYAGTTLFALLLELLIVGWEKSSLKHLIAFRPSSQIDVISWLFDLFRVYDLLAILCSLGVSYYLAGKIQGLGSLQLMAGLENGYAQVAIMLVLSDFKNYIRHFVFHKVKFFWLFHEFHHAAKEFTTLTFHRGHVLSKTFSRFFDIIPFILLGASMETYLIVRIIKEVVQLLQHSNWQSDWGFIGKWIFVSPLDHRLHHSTHPDDFNKNMGSLFVVWDKLFGTYKPGRLDLVIGPADDRFNKGYVQDFLLVYRRMIRSLLAVFQVGRQ